jgi:PAS domain-containing protein
MANSPAPISERDRKRRVQRIRRIAQEFGFVGQVEYRHLFSRTGGASYGQASTEADDLLTVYAEAFERDADPDDFSLEAMIAHEMGHQMLARHPLIARRVAGRISRDSEEILASILGALICKDAIDRHTLVDKAAVELLGYGVPDESVERQVLSLLDQLGELL